MFLNIYLAAILLIGGKELQIEIADTPQKRNAGLMHRESLNENEGMLFIFPSPDFLSFWMKNTKIPLSIGFFDTEQRLVQIENMNPPPSDNSPLVIYSSKLKAKYALEVPQKWFEKNKIIPGQKFTLQDLKESIK